MNTIIAYQFKNSVNLYALGLPEYILVKDLSIFWGSYLSKMDNAVAKWTIKLKR